MDTERVDSEIDTETTGELTMATPEEIHEVSNVVTYPSELIHRKSGERMRVIAVSIYWNSGLQPQLFIEACCDNFSVSDDASEFIVPNPLRTKRIIFNATTGRSRVEECA